jgi:hypothetical protein
MATQISANFDFQEYRKRKFKREKKRYCDICKEYIGSARKLKQHKKTAHAC